MIVISSVLLLSLSTEKINLVHGAYISNFFFIFFLIMKTRFCVRSFAFNFPNTSSQPSQTKLLDGNAKSLLIRVPASANEFSGLWVS